MIRVVPPLQGAVYGLGEAIVEFLLLSPKYQGDSLFPISELPTNVYVFLPLIEYPQLRESFLYDEVKKIAFAKIHKTSTVQSEDVQIRRTNPW